MVKQQVRLDEVISVVAIGQPAIVRVNGTLVRTLPVESFNLGYPSTRIETQDTVYLG